MLIRVRCPKCEEIQFVEKTLEGKFKRCSHCGKLFKVPKRALPGKKVVNLSEKKQKEKVPKFFESSDEEDSEKDTDSDKVQAETYGEKSDPSVSEAEKEKQLPSIPPPYVAKKPVLTSANVVTCPHCWEQFGIEDILYIAQHKDLVGDPLLGPEEQQRFLPSHFTPEGHAIDSMGLVCPDRACPYCHLPIPRVITEVPSIYLSIVGSVSSGKSFFLVTLIHELRNIMPRYFAMSFRDADPHFNNILNEYENELFFNTDVDAMVTIQKTQKEGILYNQINKNGMVIKLPRPFIFLLSKSGISKPEYKEKFRLLVFYDNAGEHFEPGTDTAANPVTHHLLRSKGIFFVFDPTQDIHFRSLCRGNDPQLAQEAKVRRQEILLTEMIVRLRKHLGIKEESRCGKPLFILCSKFDLWQHLLDIKVDDKTPWQLIQPESAYALNRTMIREISGKVREILKNTCPELVYTAESFSNNVLYFPFSALGRSPQVNTATGLLSIKPRDINPIWVSVPLLYLLGLLGLIPFFALNEK